MITHQSVADSLATHPPGRPSDKFIAGINWTRLEEEIPGSTLEIEKRHDGSESETGDGFVSADELLANPTLLEPPRVVLPFLAYYARTTVLSGSWKCGKSTLTAQAVAQAVIAHHSRRDFLGEAVPQGSWLWMALDEPLGDLWRRLYGFGLTEPGATIGFYDHHRPTLAQLADRLDRTHACGLVIDSLTNYARGLVTDAKQAAEWEVLFSDLASVTAPRGVAVVFLHHTPYGGDTPRPADSRQIGASADMVITLTRPDKNDEETRKLAAIGRGVQYEHLIRYNGEGGYQFGSSRPSVAIQIADRLRRADGPGKRQIRTDVGGDQHAVDQNLREMIQHGIVEVRVDGQKHRHYLTTLRPEFDLGGSR